MSDEALTTDDVINASKSDTASTYTPLLVITPSSRITASSFDYGTVPSDPMLQSKPPLCGSLTSLRCPTLPEIYRGLVHFNERPLIFHVLLRILYQRVSHTKNTNEDRLVQKQIKQLLLLVNIRAGINLFLNTIWMPTFSLSLLGELLYAIINHDNLKSFWQILAGISPYAYSLTGNYNSVYTDVIFWIMPIAVVSILAATVSLFHMRHNYRFLTYAYMNDSNKDQMDFKALEAAKDNWWPDIRWLIPGSALNWELMHLLFILQCDPQLDFPTATYFGMSQVNTLSNYVFNLAEGKNILTRFNGYRALAEIIDTCSHRSLLRNSTSTSKISYDSLVSAASHKLSEASKHSWIANYFAWRSGLESKLFLQPFWIGFSLYSSYCFLRLVEVFVRKILDSALREHCTNEVLQNIIDCASHPSHISNVTSPAFPQPVALQTRTLSEVQNESSNSLLSMCMSKLGIAAISLFIIAAYLFIRLILSKVQNAAPEAPSLFKNVYNFFTNRKDPVARIGNDSTLPLLPVQRPDSPKPQALR